MALAHDAQTRFPATDTTGLDTTTGDRTFTHAPVGTPKGVVVVLCVGANVDGVTGVLYAGAAMTKVRTAQDTVETGRVTIWTLTETAIPTDNPATVTLQGCTADSKWCTCSTVTAATDGTKVNASNNVDTTTSTNPTVTVVTSATTLLYGAVHGGAAAPTSYVSGTGYTTQFSADYGAKSARSQRRTSPVAAGSIVFDFTFGTSDDWCIAAVALEEFTLPAAAAALVRFIRARRHHPTVRPANRRRTSVPPSVAPCTPTIREVLATATSGVNATVVTGAGTQVDDLLVCFHGNNFFTAAGMGTPTGTAGTWTLQATGDNGTDSAHMKCWTRRVTVAGAQTITCSPISTEEVWNHVFVLAGADLTDPSDDAAGSNGATSTSHVAPSISPVTADALLLCAAQGAGSIATYTPPSGMTEQTDLNTPGFGAGSTASKALTASGPTGTQTFISSVSNPFATASIAVKCATPTPPAPKTAQFISQYGSYH